MKFIKTIFIVLSTIALVVGVSFVRATFSKSLAISIALAEDDDEDEDDEDDDEEERKSSNKTVTTYETVYVKLPDTVIEKITQVPLHDSDSDGIYDDKDPYPYVNKFFVVEDKNLNGIDDEYEKFSE